MSERTRRVCAYLLCGIGCGGIGAVLGVTVRAWLNEGVPTSLAALPYKFLELGIWGMAGAVLGAALGVFAKYLDIRDKINHPPAPHEDNPAATPSAPAAVDRAAE